MKYFVPGNNILQQQIYKRTNENTNPFCCIDCNPVICKKKRKISTNGGW